MQAERLLAPGAGSIRVVGELDLAIGIGFFGFRASARV